MSSNLSELNSSLLAVLECPVCMVYMTHHIRQCQNGHNICSECIKKVNKCPTCRNNFIETRNYPLEEIASKMQFPCEFKDQGCSIALKFEDLQEHKKTCIHGNRRCAVRMCTWRGAVTMFLAHMKEMHPMQVLQKDAGYYFTLLEWDWLSSKKNGWQVFLLKTLGEHFWVHVKQEGTNEKVMVSVQHVCTEKIGKFRYEVKLDGTEASSVYRAPTITDKVQMNTVFVAESCFCTSIRALKQFRSKTNDVLLKLKVERV